MANPPETRNAAHSGRPANFRQNSITKAGTITNSPCAKLIVPEACQSKVKPRAASAAIAPVAVPAITRCRKSLNSAFLLPGSHLHGSGETAVNDELLSGHVAA